jgi:hypothetical protein
MPQTDRFKPTRLFAGLAAGLLFAICTLQPGAQTAPGSRATRSFSVGYDTAHEVTVNGTVQEVVSKHVAGSPAGMHILVASSKSIVDAHLGPFLTKGTQEALHTGTPVEIVGAVETIHGKEYLLARQLILGGRTVTVRSEKGFLVRAYSPRVAHSKPDGQTESKFHSELTGGAR